MTTTASGASELVARAKSISREIAAAHAADVDKAARFPHETLAALKQARLLSAAVPKECGGGGASMRELAEHVRRAGAGLRGGAAWCWRCTTSRSRASRGTAVESPFFRGYLRELVEQQLLIASITSEVGICGDTRSSICALEQRRRPLQARQGRDHRARTASTPTTCSSPAGATRTRRQRPGPRARAQGRLHARRRRRRWDTLGMRGTCSPGLQVVGVGGPVEQVVPGSFADSSAQTMVRTRTSCGRRVWLGIAADAVARAGAYVRAEARKKPGHGAAARRTAWPRCRSSCRRCGTTSPAQATSSTRITARAERHGRAAHDRLGAAR